MYRNQGGVPPRRMHPAMAPKKVINAPVPYRNYGGSGTPGGFYFQRKNGRLDWRNLAAVDIEKVIREVDVDTLQSNLEHITYADIESEDLRNLSEANFVKLFRLCQLMIEYLLFAQDFLANANGILDSERNELLTENDELRKLGGRQNEELAQLKKEIRQKRRIVATYEYMLMSPANNGALNVVKELGESTAVYKCPICEKLFTSAHFLGNHIQRRHPGMNADEYRASPLPHPTSMPPMQLPSAREKPVDPAVAIHDIILEERKALEDLRKEMEGREVRLKGELEEFRRKEDSLRDEIKQLRVQLEEKPKENGAVDKLRDELTQLIRQMKDQPAEVKTTQKPKIHFTELEDASDDMRSRRDEDERAAQRRRQLEPQAEQDRQRVLAELETFRKAADRQKQELEQQRQQQQQLVAESRDQFEELKNQLDKQLEKRKQQLHAIERQLDMQAKNVDTLKQEESKLQRDRLQREKADLDRKAVESDEARARRQKEEDEKRKLMEEERRRMEEARKKMDEDGRKRMEDERRRKMEEGKKKLEEEARKRMEEEARRKKLEEDARRSKSASAVAGPPAGVFNQVASLPQRHQSPEPRSMPKAAPQSRRSVSAPVALPLGKYRPVPRAPFIATLFNHRPEQFQIESEQVQKDLRERLTGFGLSGAVGLSEQQYEEAMTTLTEQRAQDQDDEDLKAMRHAVEEHVETVVRQYYRPLHIRPPKVDISTLRPKPKPIPSKPLLALGTPTSRRTSALHPTSAPSQEDDRGRTTERDKEKRVKMDQKEIEQGKGKGKSAMKAKPSVQMRDKEGSSEASDQSDGRRGRPPAEYSGAVMDDEGEDDQPDPEDIVDGPIQHQDTNKYSMNFETYHFDSEAEPLSAGDGGVGPYGQTVQSDDDRDEEVTSYGAPSRNQGGSKIQTVVVGGKSKDAALDLPAAGKGSAAADTAVSRLGPAVGQSGPGGRTQDQDHEPAPSKGRVVQVGGRSGSTDLGSGLRGKAQGGPTGSRNFATTTTIQEVETDPDYTSDGYSSPAPVHSRQQSGVAAKFPTRGYNHDEDSVDPVPAAGKRGAAQESVQPFSPGDDDESSRADVQPVRSVNRSLPPSSQSSFKKDLVPDDDEDEDISSIDC